MRDRSSLQSWVLYAVTFFLPLQTQYLLHIPQLGGEEWQYGRFGVYAIDLLIILAIVLAISSRKDIHDAQQQAFVAMWVFILALVATSFFHGTLKEHWLMMLRFIEGALFVWAFVQSGVRLRNVVLCFVFGMALVSLFGIWQFAVQFVPESSYFGIASQESLDPGVSIVASDEGRYLRSYGTLPHPNIFGGFIAFALLGLLWFVLTGKEQKKFASRVGARDMWWIVTGVIMFTALLLSFSRSAWLGLAVGVTVLLYMTFRADRKTYFIVWLKAALVPVILVTVLSSIVVPIFRQRVAVTESHEIVSVEDRIRSGNDALEILKENWWKGVGLSRFTFYVHDSIDADRTVWQLQPVHNIFLLIAAEASVFSGLLFIAFLGILFVESFKKAMRIISRLARIPESALSVAGIAAIVVIGLFDAYFISLSPGIFLLFFILALSISAIGEHETAGSA